MAHPNSRRSSQTGQPPPTSRTTGPTPAQPPVPNPKTTTAEQKPMLESTVPSVFVPLPPGLDITKPVDDLPRDRIERLKHIIATIDKHGLIVKENILWLLEEEKKRMVLEAREQERELKPKPIKAGLPASEVDVVIQSLAAPADPARSYQINSPINLDLSRPRPADLAPRQLVVRHLYNLMNNGTRELKGYDDHIRGIRQYYEDLLKKEMARMELIGMRPEDRPKGAEAKV